MIVLPERGGGGGGGGGGRRRRRCHCISIVIVVVSLVLLFVLALPFEARLAERQLRILELHSLAALEELSYGDGDPAV